MKQKLLTRENILKMADNRIDISILSPEALRTLNETVKGDYATAQEEHYKSITRGVDMFLTIGSPVEISYKGKTRNSIVTEIDYEQETEFFKVICNDKSVFQFRTSGFASFGNTGAYYGLVEDPNKKSGIRYLDFIKK